MVFSSHSKGPVDNTTNCGNGSISLAGLGGAEEDQRRVAAVVELGSGS